jgi:hypothetical protein
MAITNQKIGRSTLWSSETPSLLTWFAPSDYCLFHNLKKHLKGRQYSSTGEATLAVDRWFAAQLQEFFLDGLKKLEQRSHKHVKLRGEYVM